MAGRRENETVRLQASGQHEQAANERKPEQQVRNIARDVLPIDFAQGKNERHGLQQHGCVRAIYIFYCYLWTKEMGWRVIAMGYGSRASRVVK